MNTPTILFAPLPTLLLPGREARQDADYNQGLGNNGWIEGGVVADYSNINRFWKDISQPFTADFYTVSSLSATDVPGFGYTSNVLLWFDSYTYASLDGQGNAVKAAGADIANSSWRITIYESRRPDAPILFQQNVSLTVDVTAIKPNSLPLPSLIAGVTAIRKTARVETTFLDGQALTPSIVNNYDDTNLPVYLSSGSSTININVSLGSNVTRLPARYFYIEIGYGCACDWLSLPESAHVVFEQTKDHWLTVAPAPFATDDSVGIVPALFRRFLEPSRIDAFTDPHGVMFSAVKESTGVRVSRFPNGTASRELLALVPNLSSPSLWQHNTQAGEHQESDAAIYLFGKDATANVWKMFVSDDDGESFDFMANTPFDGTYKVIGAPIGHNCVGLIAVKGTAVTFARTSDGVNYDTFANGTKINSVGDLGASAKTLSFHSEFAFGTDYLKVSNGVDWACGSDDGGDTWDVI